MNKLEQAARQALDALEKIAYDTANPDTEKAITALREALAEQAECPHGVDDGACKECYMEQAEQEPVAIMSPNKANIVGINTPHANIGTNGWIPLYTHPVRTKDLTVSELNAIVEKYYDDEIDLKAMILDGIAADREKNK